MEAYRNPNLLSVPPEESHPVHRTLEKVSSIHPCILYLYFICLNFEHVGTISLFFFFPSLLVFHINICMFSGWLDIVVFLCWLNLGITFESAYVAWFFQKEEERLRMLAYAQDSSVTVTRFNLVRPVLPWGWRLFFYFFFYKYFL